MGDEKIPEEGVSIRTSEDKTLKDFAPTTQDLSNCASKNYVIQSAGAFQIKVFEKIPTHPLEESAWEIDYGQEVLLGSKEEGEFQEIQFDEKKGFVRKKWLVCREDSQIQVAEDRSQSVFTIEKALDKIQTCQISNPGIKSQIPCVYRSLTLMKLNPDESHSFFEKTESLDGKIFYEYGELPYCYVEEKYIVSCRSD